MPELSHVGMNSHRVMGLRVRRLDRAGLERALRGQRAVLLAHLRQQPETEVPYLAGINPPLWELAHLGWFDEWFCVRLPAAKGDAECARRVPSLWPGSDAFLDSNRIAHGERWRLPQLTHAAVADYLSATGEALAQTLIRLDEGQQSLEPFRLALLHQAMHMESLAWCAQALAQPAPVWVRERPRLTPGVRYLVPAQATRNLPDPTGFAFDNEAHAQLTATTELEMSGLITTAEFALFVASGEYRRRLGRESPCYWRRKPNSEHWQHRIFEHWMDAGDDPSVLIHINAKEAEAYASFRQARLPSEDELSQALLDEDGESWGKHAPADAGWLWEWTSSTFAPYPGFTVGLYREYSAPSFEGQHRVLKGGSIAGGDWLTHPRFRNFFRPERADVFAGFRLVFG